MSALCSRTAHEREPSATATADVRTHARMRVGRASCGYSRAGAQRHRHVGAFWAIGGFVVLRASPPVHARVCHIRRWPRGRLLRLKKHHPCVSLVELGVGVLASRPASALVSGIAAELPSESTPTTANSNTPLPWRSRPWHTAFATSNAEEHARVHTVVTVKNAISGHIFAIQAAARVTQVPHRARRRGHEPPPRFYTTKAALACAR